MARQTRISEVNDLQPPLYRSDGLAGKYDAYQSIRIDFSPFATSPVIAKWFTCVLARLADEGTAYDR